MSHNEREDGRGCGNLEGSSEDGVEAVHILHMNEALEARVLELRISGELDSPASGD